MAKKKINEENNPNRKQLEKDFGDIFIDPQTIIDKKLDIFSLGPKLDIALSGGLPSGSWGIISGLSGIGKSSAALQICAQAQKEEFGSRKCYYFDVEHRLEKKNLSGIPGLSLDKDKLEVISSTRGNILTAEKVLTVAERLLKDEPGIIIVIDSSSSLCTAKEYDGEISAVGRNEGPKLLAQFTRKLNGVVPVQDSLVIIIQHLIANTSGYGSPWLEDGGNKIVYQSNFKLRGVSFKKWEQGEKQIGQVNNWHIIKSALGQPNAKVESYLRFGSGIDFVWELIELACDVGLITKGGAWFNLDFLENPEKLQGQQNVWDFLNSNKDKLKLLESKVKEFYVS
jgi:recombination protein RecA